MKFVIDPHADINMSSLQGRLNVSFDELVRCFGPPSFEWASEKTQCEWYLVFEDNTIATIYDYKMGEIPVHQINNWSVGGFTKRAYTHVLSTLEESNVKLV